MNPAIVVNAYNRPQALARLLAALSRAEFPAHANIPLIISIDRRPHGIDPEVLAVAQAAGWLHGPLHVRPQERHLGLVGHFMYCGGLAEEFGAAIYLEDDLLVSRDVYRYAAAALAHYWAEPRLAGLSLYGLWFNGYTRQPFIPLADGGDTFFIQAPYTQGLVFTAGQWQAFREWASQADRRLTITDNLHEAFFHFAPDDWFPLLAKYLVDTGHFMVYPRQSHTSGSGDAGTHFVRPSPFLQTPLQYGHPPYRFLDLDQALSVYDSFFELQPERLDRLTDRLRGLDYELDLNATKARRNLRADYVLTSRPCRQARLSFGRSLWPAEANVIEGASGRELSLCHPDEVRWDWWADLMARKRSYDYFSRRRAPGCRQRLLFAVVGLADRFSQQSKS